MLDTFLGCVVQVCIRRSWSVIIMAIVIAAAAGAYTFQHFAINTDINSLISSDAGWRQAERAITAAFPQQNHTILVVIQGQTPELADAAAATLTKRLSQMHKYFRSVEQTGGGDFFRRNRFLYLHRDELAQTMHQIQSAAPLIRIFATDSSLRGLTRGLSASLEGVRGGYYTLDQMVPRLNLISDSVEGALSGRDASFSWDELISGVVSAPEKVRVISVWPVLDYDTLEPGRRASHAIRAAANDTGIGSKFLSRIFLTGPVPFADEQFASLNKGAALNGVISAGLAILILWLALRSLRIVAAVIVTVVVGLSVTGALGLLLVGAFNPISIAFAVLFVGIGVDYAIQFSVRYRAERFERPDLDDALVSATRRIGAPLTLAAAAAAAGFFSFLPTNYQGLAELGLIAGCGMVVAYIASMTLLPALLYVFKPPNERKPLGYSLLAPADRFLQRRRILVVALTSIAALAGSPALLHLKFDFSPTHLRNPGSETAVGLRLLEQGPRIGKNTAEVLVPAADVQKLSKQLSGLPQVKQVQSLANFIPDEQTEKLALVRKAAAVLLPALDAKKLSPPTDAENASALRRASEGLEKAISTETGPGAIASNRLARDLNQLAAGTSETRRRVESAFISPLTLDLAELRS